MTDLHSTESPLEAAAGAAGPRATEAFALLGNETRLAILLALWEEHEPGMGEETVVPFSELYDRIDYDNAGNFSYHLEKLTGQFVRKRGERGYELRKTGLKLVQAVIAGAGVQDVRLERTDVDMECWFCGAPTAVFYRDGGLYQVCTECEGLTTEDELPDGFLNAMKLHPAALTDRSPEELFGAAAVAAHRHIRTMFEGLCSTCSGPVDASLQVCADHDDDGECVNCGREYAYWTKFRCLVCKDHHVTTPSVLALFHPAVIAFYDDHGISTAWHAADFESITRIVGLYTDHEMELVSEDPPSVAVTVGLDGDECRVTFDETASVVDVAR